MIQAKAGFVVYGVHKDGLKDPMGNVYIDCGMIENSKKALNTKGIELIHSDLVVAAKKEAKEVICAMAKDDSVDCLILFSGTWVWAAHLVGAIREFAKTGKGIVIWTHPGSQGWRPVGGLVLSGALKEIGIPFRFVYGAADSEEDISKIVSYCMASAVKNKINMTTMGSFGGRGMGQTCGVADPSQWMKVFGIDIDSRDTTELIERAKSISEEKIRDAYAVMKKKFVALPENNEVSERSIRLYLALKELIAENDFDYYTLQSYPGLADDYTASCFAQSMMLEDGVPTSTLSDFNTAMVSILLTYLSRERVYYGDLQHIDKNNNEIKIIGDGAVPPSLANEDGASFAEHGIPTEGKAGGLSVHLICKKGEGVLARLGREDGRFKMVLARCRIDVPAREELQKRKNECGIPFWPHAFVTAECDIEKLLANWNNEYACLGYGKELYQQIIDFCELTNIEVVAL